MVFSKAEGQGLLEPWLPSSGLLELLQNHYQLRLVCVMLGSLEYIWKGNRSCFQGFTSICAWRQQWWHSSPFSYDADDAPLPSLTVAMKQVSPVWRWSLRAKKPGWKLSFCDPVHCLLAYPVGNDWQTQQQVDKLKLWSPGKCSYVNTAKSRNQERRKQTEIPIANVSDTKMCHCHMSPS